MKIENSEIIVIDDGSIDNTYNILKKLDDKFPYLKVIRNQSNLGHGPAITSGYKAASKEYIFQFDSDDQFNPNDFYKLYSYINNYDIVIGYRKYRKDPYVRKLLSSYLILLIFLLFRIHLWDPNCPFRIYKRDVLQELLTNLDTNVSIPNMLAILIAKIKGFNLIEITIDHFPRKTGHQTIINKRLIILIYNAIVELFPIKFKKFNLKY